MFSVAVSAVLIALPSSPVRADSSPANSAYGQMAKVNLSRNASVQAKVDELERIFSASFAPLLKSVKNLADDELRFLYGASDMLASYTMFFNTSSNGGYIESMSAAFRELRRRSIATDADAGNMFDALVTSRRFEEAELLKLSDPVLADKVVPVIVKVTGFREDAPAEMTLTSAQDTFLLRNVSLDGGYRIVIVSGCHVSEGATKAIDADPKMRDAFAKGGAIWLAPANRDFEARAVQRWNDEFPRQRMTVAYKNGAWKGIDFSQIPAFYFYRDGKLIAEQTGWQNGGVPPKITAALRSMGLLAD